MARGLPVVAALLAATGLVLAARGSWIPVKAAVAQVLLRQAWEETLAGKNQARPWPWADTWPVAKLAAPEHDVDLVVLAGAGGGSLAFAPGHLDGSALPGSPGTALLAGHRDTHFEFLRDLRIGDRLELETPAGESLEYRVVDLSIVDTREPVVLAAGAARAGSTGSVPARQLALVTCYPFETVVPGGPLRYVVSAEQLEPDPRERQGPTAGVAWRGRTRTTWPVESKTAVSVRPGT